MIRKLSRELALLSLFPMIITGSLFASGAQEGKAEELDPWKRFSGETLYVLVHTHPTLDVIGEHIQEFEARSGMKVVWESPASAQSRQKLMVAMTSKSSTPDVFFASLHVEKKRFWKNGWTHPLNEYLKDKSLTLPDFDWEGDYSDGIKSLMIAPDGKSIMAFPAFVDANILYYRKDIFSDKGLSYPKTLEEMEKAAEMLHGPPELYGFVARGRKRANATAFSTILFPMGGKFLTDKGNPALNTKECIAALDYYGRMVRRYAPPGAVNFDWYEASSVFLQGKAAMYPDGITLGAQFEDPAKSKVKGKVGYALPPAGPAGQFSPIFGTGLSISTYSKNKDAAYLFIQWALSKQMALNTLRKGIAVPRTSTWGHPDIKANPMMPWEWYEIYPSCFQIARQGLPAVTGVIEYRDIIGVAITEVIEGNPADEAAAKAQKEFQELLERLGDVPKTR